MRIAPVREIGAYRPLCQHQIRVAEGMRTDQAQRSAWRREKAGVPIDQCGTRSDFLVDGVPTCRPHAGQMALAYLLNLSTQKETA